MRRPIVHLLQPRKRAAKEDQIGNQKSLEQVPNKCIFAYLSCFTNILTIIELKV